MNIANLAASIGIGAAQFQIHLPTKYCPRGTNVSGQVELVGGHVPQHVEFLSVSLVEHWSSGRDTHNEERDVRIVAADLDILPHGRGCFPFEFYIPDNARLTDMTGSNG